MAASKADPRSATEQRNGQESDAPPVSIPAALLASLAISLLPLLVVVGSGGPLWAAAGFATVAFVVLTFLVVILDRVDPPD